MSNGGDAKAVAAQLEGNFGFAPQLSPFLTGEFRDKTVCQDLARKKKKKEGN